MKHSSLRFIQNIPLVIFPYQHCTSAALEDLSSCCALSNFRNLGIGMGLLLPLL